MKILFYVDPVTIRGNPTYYSPIINIVRCLINANRKEGVLYGLATSRTLLGEYDKWLRYGGVIDISRFELDATSVLDPYHFDRNLYARDLFSTEPTRHAYLLEELTRIRRAFEPDIVVCPTQNTLLQDIFGRDRTLFCETGPLPRWDGQGNFYFDGGGHQKSSILETEISSVLNLPIADEAAEQVTDRFLTFYGRQPDLTAPLDYFKNWLSTAAKGRKIALIANQPADSLLVSGGFGPIPTDGFMMRVLQDLPDGWVAVPTYHRDAPGSAELDAHFQKEFPNFLALPDPLQGCGSDRFLTAIDGLVTIGSKAALSAVIMGKPIVAYGQTMMAGLGGRTAADLAAPKALTRVEIGRLLCFLSNRYSFSFEDCFKNSGAILDFFEGYQGACDKARYQLDVTHWNPERFDKLFGMA